MRLKRFEAFVFFTFLASLFGHLGCPGFLASYGVASDASASGSVSAEWVPPRLREAPRPITQDVFYFVLVDRFANGDPGNDRGGERDPLGGETLNDRLRHGYWPSQPSFYHGGDLKGLLGRLDYLQKLGVTALWLSPVMKNLPVQHTERGKDAVAGYHGYYITDFTTVDPHLGTEDDLHALVSEAHRLDMKVFLDIVVNHTADVIRYKECHPCPYRSTSEYPNKPYTPYVPPELEGVKKPAWLNDPRFYNNRGNSTFSGESSVLGDFHELDDLRTSDPEVVRGMIDIYSSWIRRFHIDGFRLDTVKHVDPSFWSQFVPAMKQVAAEVGISDFFVFGEVYSAEVAVLAEQALRGRLDSVLDFAAQAAVRAMATAQTPSVSSAGASAGDGFTRPYQLTLEQDDQYRTGFPPQHLMTFLSNHDVGRMGGFLKESGVPQAQWLPRMVLAHSVLFFGRGVPIVYYGDEQGFVGSGPDTGARQDMWAARDVNGRIGASPAGGTSADAAFDDRHPLYTALAAFGQARRQIPALQDGEHLPLQHGQDFLAPSTVQAFRRTLRSHPVTQASSGKKLASTDVMVFLNWGESSAQVKVPGDPQVLFTWPARPQQSGGEGVQTPEQAKELGVQPEWRGSLNLPASSVAIVHVAPSAQVASQGGLKAEGSTQKPNAAHQTVEPDWSSVVLADLSPNDRVSGRVAVRVDVPQSLIRRVRAVEFFCFLDAPKENGQACNGSGGRLVADPTPPFQAFVDVRGIRNGTPVRIEARVFADTGRVSDSGQLSPVRALSLPLVVDERLPVVSVFYANPFGASHVQLIADNGFVSVLDHLQPAAHVWGAGSSHALATQKPSAPGTPPSAAGPGLAQLGDALGSLPAVTHTFQWPRGARSVQLTYARLSLTSETDAPKGTPPQITLDQIDQPVVLSLDEHVFSRAREDLSGDLSSREQLVTTHPQTAAFPQSEQGLLARVFVDAWGRVADPDGEEGAKGDQGFGPNVAPDNSGEEPVASARPPLPLRPVALGLSDQDQSVFWASLFVRGGMNGWEPRDQLMPLRGAALAQTRLKLSAGRVEFKIADKDWSSGRNFGAPVGLNGFTSSGQSSNLYLNIEPGQAGMYRFFFGRFGGQKQAADTHMSAAQSRVLQLFVIREEDD